ncbi:hypothetical protein HK102_010916, partial [Quaeritorhiza haematococci]
VMVEETSLVRSSPDGRREEIVRIHATGVNEGDNIREVGSDVAVGELVMGKGEMVSAVGAEVGLLASVGIKEVVEHNFPGSLQHGQIRDTNRVSLKAALDTFGFPWVDLGVAGDSADTLSNTLNKGLHTHKCDVIITTGGVSMGEYDLLKPTLEQKLGAVIHFGRVKLKPGKPTTFATVPGASSSEPDKLIFSLPGNPVSAVVTFYLFVIPALKRLAGYLDADLPTIKAS